MFSLDLPVFLLTFANMNKHLPEQQKWSENIILADADYINNVAFNFIVNFERMLGRRIPKADMARWIDCVALDGGLRNGNNDTLVILIHNKKNAEAENFMPSSYDDELDGKAFKDSLGEFVITSVPVEDITTKEELFTEVLALACAQKEVKRIMVVPDDEKYYDEVRNTLRRTGRDDIKTTVFGMQPRQGGNFFQEILGYSIMSALGIKAEEIK